MTTLTVQEATQGLGSWLRRAANGEQIAISEGAYVVLLQPLGTASPAAAPLTAREALRTLQTRPALSAAEAEDYLRTVRDERLAEGEPRA